MKKVVLLVLLGSITLIGSVANTALSLFDELTHYRNLGSLKAISALKKDNVRLTKQNKSLSNKIKAAKKKVAVRKNKVLKKSLVRANRKIATAGAALIPVSGTVVVGAAMALEIHELCKDSKDMAAFEKDLFGEGADFVLDEETESGPDETKLCGMDVDVQIEEVQNRVASSYQSLKDKTVTTFLEGAESIRQWEASLLADTEDNLSDIFEELRRALAFQYQSGSDSFIEPNTTPYEGFSQKGTIIRLNND